MSASGGISRGAGFNTAVLSGLDSISSGISKSVEGGNIKRDVIESFRPTPRDRALIASPRDPAFQISAAGDIPSPGIFFYSAKHR